MLTANAGRSLLRGMDPPLNYKGKIIELEGLRGLAILLVTFHHFWPATGAFYNFMAPFAHLGWIGVDLFFVISGLLIGGILLDTRGAEGYFQKFYIRRILRIFPLYYALVVSLFIVVPLGQAFLHDVSYGQSEFVQESGGPFWYLLFAGNIREAITGVEPAYFLAPLWSISIEEQFYLLSPLLISSLSLQQLKYVLFGFMAFAPLFRLTMIEIQPDNERIQYLATLSRLDNLSVGVLLALLIRTSTTMPRKETTLVVAVVLGLILCTAFFLGGLDRTTWFCRVFGYSLLAAFFGAVVLWALQNRGQAQASFLRSSWLVYPGGLCYGLYLLQRPAEIFLLKLTSIIGFDLEEYPFISLASKTVFSIFVAYLSWHCFEKPINNMRKRFRSADHPLEQKAIHNNPLPAPCPEMRS